MFTFIKIAFKNILRQKRRSLITGASMSIGAAILVFGSALINGVQRQQIDNMVAQQTGHIQVYPPGESEVHDTGGPAGPNIDLRTGIPNHEEVERLVREDRRVVEVGKRVNWYGAIFARGNSIFSGIVGVEPGAESRLKAALAPDMGEYLSDGGSGIYVSTTTAKELGIEVGDDVSFMVRTIDGATNADDYFVEGIFKKGPPWMEWESFIGLRKAQELIDLGERVGSMLIFLHDPRQAGNVAASLRQKFEGKNWPLKAETWEEAGGFYFGIIAANRITLLVTYAIMFVVVIVLVMNTMIMAVHERTKEIGTVLALGMKRESVLGLFILESSILGLIAAGIGVLVGSLASLWIGRVGIYSGEAMSYAFGGPRLHPLLDGTDVVSSYAAILILGVIAALYPAYLASKMEPVEALRYV